MNMKTTERSHIRGARGSNTTTGLQFHTGEKVYGYIKLNLFEGSVCRKG